MTLTLELSPEQEAALQAHAQARGMSVEEWLSQLADQLAPPVSVAHLQKTGAGQRIRIFRPEFADNLANLQTVSCEWKTNFL